MTGLIRNIVNRGIYRRKYPPADFVKEVENLTYKLIMVSYLLGVLHIREAYKKHFAEIPADIFLEPDKALEFFKSLVVLPSDEYYKLDNRAKQYALNIGKLTGIRAMERVKTAIERALKEGYTLQEIVSGFAKDEVLNKAGLGLLNGWYWETVVRTNAVKAYNAGRWYGFEEVKDSIKALEYIAIDDNRTTELCRYLDGTIKKIDDPFWKRYTPPNHIACRSTVRAIFKGTGEAEKIRKYTKIDESKLTELEGYTEEFSYSPATDWWKLPKSLMNEINSIYKQSYLNEFWKNTPAQLSDVLDEKIKGETPELLKQVDELARGYLKTEGGLSDTEIDEFLKVYRELVKRVNYIRIEDVDATGFYNFENYIVFNKQFYSSVNIPYELKRFYVLSVFHELSHLAQFQVMQTRWDKWVKIKKQFWKKLEKLIDTKIKSVKKSAEFFKKYFINNDINNLDNMLLDVKKETNPLYIQLYLKELDFRQYGLSIPVEFESVLTEALLNKDEFSDIWRELAKEWVKQIKQAIEEDLINKI